MTGDWILDITNKKLYLEDIPDPHSPCLEPDYPKLFWNIENNDLIFVNFKVCHSPALEPNYPKLFWSITDGNLSPATFKPQHSPALEPIYPKYFWSIISDPLDVVNAGLYDYEPLGAFRNSTNLEFVKIPKSTKWLGENAFEYTALSEVTIAKDCIYYNNTFPDDCNVHNF